MLDLSKTTDSTVISLNSINSILEEVRNATCLQIEQTNLMLENDLLHLHRFMHMCTLYQNVDTEKVSH